MGSIVETRKTDKRTGKEILAYRVHIRRGGVSRSKVFPTKTAAKDWLRDNESEVKLKEFAKQTKGGKAFIDLVEDFIKLSDCAYAKFSHLDYWKEWFSTTKLGEIKHSDINAAKLTLKSRPAMRMTPNGLKATGKPLTPASVNRYLATLSAVLSFAMEHGLIEEHPMKGGKVKKLEEAQGRRRILIPEEEQRLLDAAKASSWPQMSLYLQMLLTTAARRSEVLNLRWQDINLDESIAILSDTKNGVPRALPLVREVRLALEEARKVRPLHSDYVFFDPKKPSRPKNVDSLWLAVRKRAGLWQDREDRMDQVVLHTTRHTAVTKMLKGGANLAQAASVSGHKTLAMLKRYEHLAAKDAVQLAENLLSKVGQ